MSDGIYAAENAVDPGRRFATVASVQEYVDSLTSAEWWARFSPHVIRIEVVRIRSDSVDAVGRCEYERGAGVIGITRRGQDQLTVLHEVAHAVRDPGEGHGPEWVRTYLELVYRSMGMEHWSALRTAFYTPT